MAVPSSRWMNSSVNNNLDFIINVEDNYQSWYLPLYKSLNEGNWEIVEIIIKQESGAITARLTPFAETPLLVAVKAGQGLPFIRKLLTFMQPEALALVDYFGNTALHAVAVHGEIQAAKLFVEKSPDLPHIWNVDGYLPIHLAAMRGHRDMTLYLLSVTREDDNLDPFKDAAGATLMQFAVNAGFYDLALYLLEREPKLAWQHEDISPLELMAQDPSSFPSGVPLNFWQFVIYSCVPLKLIEMPESLFRMMKLTHYSSFKVKKRWENQVSRGKYLINNLLLVQLLLRITPYINDIPNILYMTITPYLMLWKVLEVVVPPLKRIRHKKSMHHHAQELIKRVCSEIKCLDNAKASSILTGPFLLGAQNGIYEIVKEILESFPHAITFVDDENHSVFHLAVMYRHEKIFKIVHRQSGHYKMSLSLLLDSGRNNILHLVGYRARQDRLDLNSGAVLQMQRELQWYKEVEKFVLPQERKSKNVEGKTPLMIFNEQHRELAAHETQWMIGMATSCTVAASLIATMVFAASITVPGGSNSNGLPIFSNRKAFILFAVSDALSLLSSITTVISFLSIFTTRYAVNDFLYALPNRLIIGLISLFLSVTALMIAFSSTIFLVVVQQNALILVAIIALACIPVTLFVYLQLPPLLNMIKSTYGPSIFD